MRPRHERTIFKVITWVYRRLPFLKYWGLRRGYLRQTGWVASNWAGTPVAQDGSPLAWYPYPALAFIAERVTPRMRVFEFGSGNSTRWWAARAAVVHAVEDDRDWYDLLVASDLPANVDLRFEVAKDSYVESIAARDETFDVVVIDGSHRNECAFACIPLLSDDAVIVWDNTEPGHIFGPGLDFLAEQGFRRIDFYGLASLNMDAHATSVLYRPQRNCFGI